MAMVRRREAGLLSERLLRTQNRSVCSAVGPEVAVMVAAGASDDALVGASSEAECIGRLLRRPPPEGGEPSLIFRSHTGWPLFLSSRKRPAGEWQLGFRLVSWQ